MADVWFGGGIDAFMQAKEDGLLEPATSDKLADVLAGFKDEENYWLSKGITVVGFLANNSVLEEL